MPPTDIARRKLLARAMGLGGVAVLAGCDRLSRTGWLPSVLESAESLTYAAQHLVTGPGSLAQEFGEADLSPSFRSNGTANPRNGEYQALVASNFADYRLKVHGLVSQPAEFSLDALRALPSRTQITRHDCVEGWSAIGKWKGARLSSLLDAVQPGPQARFVVFRCADPMGGGDRYYESIDIGEARHEQTILAYELNDRALPVANGAPIRVRVERQLGYKMAKYIMSIELVDSLAGIGGGKGGYWEDRGYEWYAGI